MKTFRSEAHSAKLPLHIDETASGISNDTRFLQLENAWCDIFLRLDGIATICSDSHRLSQEVIKFKPPKGRSMEIKPEQSAKAKAAMEVTLAGIV
eukprot:scaffold26242_cov152-Cylindrotheca_fusiformis.AAC.1